MEPESTEEIDDLINLWEELALREGEIEPDATIFDYVEHDIDIATSMEPTVAEIAQLAAEELNEEAEEMYENEVEYFGAL